jgi:hypothetical protein
MIMADQNNTRSGKRGRPFRADAHQQIRAGPPLVASSRTRAASLDGTSSTRSPAADSC